MKHLYLLGLASVIVVTTYTMDKGQPIVTRYEGTTLLKHHKPHIVYEVEESTFFGGAVLISSAFYPEEHRYGAHSINKKNGTFTFLLKQAESLYKKYEAQWQQQQAAKSGGKEK